MPGRRPSPDLDALACRQDGLVTRRQALACEVPGRTVDTWLRRGRWVSLLPGVYDVMPGRTTERQRLRAALLYGGPTAVLDGLTAARLHGLRVRDDGAVHIAVARERQVTGRDFVVVRRAAERPYVVRAGLPLLVVQQAVVVAASRLGDRSAATALLAEPVQRGFTTAQHLRSAAQRAPRHGRSIVNTAVADVLAGCRSAPEGGFRRLVATSRVLPEPLWNPQLRLPDGSVVVPDGYWPEAALVHETDSREHHLYGDAWEQTMRRHGRFSAAGLITLHSSPHRIERDGAALLAEVEAAYLLGRTRGPALGVEVIRRAA